MRATDNFFDLGGYSPLATQVVLLVDQLLEHRISIRALFERPTARGLATLIGPLLSTAGRERLTQVMRAQAMQITPER